MTKHKNKQTLGIYLLLAWMVVNASFMILELTVFGDYKDLNNSIELTLWILSIIGLYLTKKWGAALTIFALCYTLSASTGNVIYYSLWAINGPRIIINTAAIIYMFRLIFKNKFR